MIEKPIQIEKLATFARHSDVCKLDFRKSDKKFPGVILDR